MESTVWRTPYVVMVAPNGARRTKTDHPALPVSQLDIVDAVAEAFAAGAHAAHVHVRDDEGRHILDADRCRRQIDALRSRCGDDLIIQITSEAVGRYTPADQRKLVRQVCPQAVSIAVQELFSDPGDDDENREFAHWADEARVAIQWILYEPSDVAALADKVERGIIPCVKAMLFVLGRYAKDGQSTPSSLIPFLANLNAHSVLQSSGWSACAFGSAETASLVAALSLGGDVRIGFENSLWHADGRLAASNADRVAELVAVADRMGLTHATAAQARQRLGIRHP